VLPVSLDCSFLIAPSSCVPSVASFSGLFIPDCSFGILKRLFAAATVWSLAGDAFFSFDSAFRLLEFG
jgi:hypothetical protein